jgi:GT2 family glycosyltransferase
MKVSIVIPTFNQLAYTKLCLESILKNTWDIEHEIIVVDNASTDGTQEYLKQNGIFCLLNRENLGVAKAWNQGIKASRGRYVCIINNDIIAGPGWMSCLIGAYESAGNAGIVSPGTRWGELNYNFDKYAERFIKSMKTVTQEGYAGWCMLIERTRFAKSGYFSEDYAIGTGEDTDFYYALNRSGFRSFITGCAFVHHFGSQTLKSVRKEKRGFEEENLKKLREKWEIKEDTYAERKTKSLNKFMRNMYLIAVYGHTLDERRPK